MNWLNYPPYRKAFGEVVEALTKSEFRFRKLEPVIFICGQKSSYARDRLTAYLARYHKNLHIFYAEKVWSFIAEHHPEMNALQMEGLLAELADAVVILVESAGTLTELGAFSQNDKLRPKLVAVLDKEHEKEDSFVNTGPVKFLNEESRFRPCIWTDLKEVLSATSEIEERLSRITITATKTDNLTQSPKHLMFFICDVVSVFGPCSIDHIATALNKIIDFKDGNAVGILVGLGKALGLIDSTIYENREYFFRRLDRCVTFHRPGKFIDLPNLRARIVSSLSKNISYKAVSATIGQKE